MAKWILSIWIFAIATIVKLLQIPSYHSTDLEVHRHWLALTSTLPIDHWYVDTSSIWTLDYPPLFAHFSYLLSIPASLLDPSILTLSNSNHTSSTVIYLRLTAIISDLSLLIASYVLISHNKRNFSTILLILLSPGLFIVDHVHFQYNGFLLGILGISLGFLERERNLIGGIFFAILICSKHLFLVAAPVYFVYLFSSFCKDGFFKGLKRVLVMGFAVGAVFAVTFGPFVYYGQMKQVLSRLFPFGRGLTHAYWAPNIWVFYIILDKILNIIISKLGFHNIIVGDNQASFTGGLVGNSSPFSILPQVEPIATFTLVLLAMSPCLFKTYKNPNPKNIIRYVSYGFTCGFIFGWHVHEKASLQFIIPLAVLAFNSLNDAKHYFLLSIVTCYSMFPLLYEPQEYPIKTLLLLTYTTLMYIIFYSHFAPTMKNKKGLIGPISFIYLIGIVFLELYVQLFHQYLFGDKLPFLPLMLVSFYCAIGMVYSWLWQLIYIIRCT